MEIRQDNRLDDVLSFWEWNYQSFDINKMIYLIFIKSNESDKRKIKFKKYINRENIYVFEEFKKNISEINEESIEILKITIGELENKKTSSIKYIQELIDRCEEERNKEIENFTLNLEEEKRFINSCIENLKEERKNNKIFFFFNLIRKIEYSNEFGEKIIECKMNAYKGDWLNSTESEINFFSKSLSENLVDAQSNKILQSISKQATNTNESIEEIIEKFINKNQVYILAPYITNDFNINGNQSYCYTYKKNGENINIPVIEHLGFRNEIIIGDKESFGSIRFYKIIGKYSDNADEYTIASIKDFSNNKEYIKLNLCQDVRYIKSDINSLYKKKIRD
jgi:hypothetical protein